MTNFKPDRVIADVRRLAPEIPVFQVSALRGDGIAELAAWLIAKIESPSKVNN